MGRWSTTRATCVRGLMLVLAAGAPGACGIGESSSESTEVDDTALAEAAVTAAAQVDAAALRRAQVVSPVLRCVEAIGTKQLKAHFGYSNSSASAVSIPIGLLNQFVPAPAGRGQPTTFARGSVADVVQVQFASTGALTWVLGGHLAIATKLSPRCPAGGSGGRSGGGGAGGMTGAGGVTGAGGARMCPSSCDDLNPCTADSCGAQTNFVCAHAPVVDGTTCDDSNACTSGDTCQGGQCSAGPVTTCPATSEPCRVAVCDPASGACTTAPAADGTACSTGQFCTVNETCSAGVCGGGSERACPADPDTCQIPHCFPDFGGFCFFNQSLFGIPCTAIGGQPGLCNGNPSFCVAISCETCSTEPAFYQSPFSPPVPLSLTCPAPCTDALCQNVYDCLVAPTHAGSSVPSSCLAPPGTADACWCGTNPCTCTTATLPPTAANGPCLTQIAAAAGSSDPALIQSQLDDPTTSLGHAFALAECRAQYCPHFCSINVPATPAPGTVCAPPSELICVDAEHC